MNNKEIIKALENIDWHNFEAVSFNTHEILKNIFENREIIKDFLDSALKDEKLVSMAEHYDFFDKLILYVDKKNRFRIRLHIFSDDNSNVYRPHCHRWLYSSLILRGGYEHFIYGTERHIKEDIDIRNLKPIIKQEETVGSIYTLDHKVFHSIKAIPDTISFFIRGPAVKDRFLLIDKRAGKIWWEYGRESETVEEIKKKSIDANHLKKLREKIYKINLFKI